MIMSTKTANKILIVDDDEGITETMADIFREFDLHVETANSGEKALSLFESNKYSMVFMDIRMPGMSGVETFKKMKRINPSIPVSLMTAYVVDEIVEEAKREGIFEIYYKPIEISALIQDIKNTLNFKN